MDSKLSPSQFPNEGATLDHAHLARQCLGDRDFEAELLQLFREQSLGLVAEIGRGDRLSDSAKGDLAHRLRGAALAVGAWSVARSAEAVETIGRSGEAGGAGGPAGLVVMSQAIAVLEDAVTACVAEIDRLRP